MNDKKLKKARSMANDSIPKLVCSFGLTTFISLFCNALYSMTDALFISRGIGDNAMGGVSVVLPFMLIQGAIAQTVGGGAAVLVSRFIGRGEYKKAGEATLNAMAAFYISAVAVSALGFIFMLPLLRLLGATPDISGYAEEYFTIILAGNVFSTGFSSIIRAEGRMGYALAIWLIPTCINIALDAVFIFGLSMGAAGAALATVCCQFTSFLMCVIFFTRLSCQDFRGARLRAALLPEIATTGLPTLVQMGSLSLITLLFNSFLSRVAGTQGVNTFAYVGKAVTLGSVPFNAVSLAIAPVIGFNHGAGDHGRVRKTVSFSFWLCAAYSAAALAAALILPERFINIFTDSAQLIASGAEAVRIISAALPFLPVPMILSVCFQSVGRKVPALIISISTLIFLIPAFIFAENYGIIGIWCAFPAATLAAALFSAAVTAVSRKHKTHG